MIFEVQYKKINVGETVIEFHNNWLGEETVIVDGQIVSKKASIMGTSHYFSSMENGHLARYILTTRINDMMQVVIDISRNGQLLHDGLKVSYGSRPRELPNTDKQNGLKYLKEYDMDDARHHLEKALKKFPKDPEIYFHLACVHSIEEEVEQGFECLKKAVAQGLQDHEMILNHDMLAYLRMHPAFEAFLESGFTTYDLEQE